MKRASQKEIYYGTQKDTTFHLSFSLWRKGLNNEDRNTIHTCPPHPQFNNPNVNWLHI